MYCTNCGTYLEKFISVCPYCKELIEHDNIEELKLLCPDINTIVKIEFMGQEVSFTQQYSKIINTYKFFEKVLYRNKMEFAQKMIEIQDFGTKYVDKLVSLAMDSLKKTALLAEVIFNGEHIQLEYEEICKEYKHILEDGFAEVRLLIEGLEQQKMERTMYSMEEYRKNMNSSQKTRWVGGGFGIERSILGSLQASLMNAGTNMLAGVATTAGHMISKAMMDNSDKKMRAEIFNSGVFRTGVMEIYVNAMQEILAWNCQKIDNILFKSLFGGKNQKSAEKEIRGLGKLMPQEECVQEICRILLIDPYCFDIYVYIYKYFKEITSAGVLSIASNFGGILSVKYLLMQEDANLIQKCTNYLEDSEQVSQKKFCKLQEIVNRNVAYTDFELATTKIACDCKDSYVRNWFQAEGTKYRNVVGKFNCRDVVPICWDEAEENAVYAYMVYNAFEELAKGDKYNIMSRKTLLDKNEGLLARIKEGNKVAICIWATLYTKYAIADKKPYLKYAEVVYKLAGQSDALALSLIGEWFDKGIAGLHKNKYIAEIYFRRAMMLGNPYAIAYIGYYYQQGWAGYPEDKDFADDLFNLTIEVPLSMNRKTK